MWQGRGGEEERNEEGEESEEVGEWGVHFKSVVTVEELLVHW
jgi:hypothetical protein